MIATGPGEVVELPPRRRSAVTLEDAIAGRRTVRSFIDGQIGLDTLSGVLWAAQGVTSPEGLRAAPSAGALYPLSLYVMAGRVSGLAPGVWRYLPEPHGLELRRAGDCRAELAGAAMRQHWMDGCAAVLVFAAVCGRAIGKYGTRGERYVNHEVGCAAENAWLQARSFGLDAAVVGAFVDADVAVLAGIETGEQPLLLLAVGTSAGERSDHWAAGA